MLCCCSVTWSPSTPSTPSIKFKRPHQADLLPGLQWASLVQTLTNRYPKAATMVLLDLLNEPDSQYLAWDWGWNTPGATELYLKGMDAIAAVNPCALPRLCAAPAGRNIVPSQKQTAKKSMEQKREKRRRVPAWGWGWTTD